MLSRNHKLAMSNGLPELAITAASSRSADAISLCTTHITNHENPNTERAITADGKPAVSSCHTLFIDTGLLPTAGANGADAVENIDTEGRWALELPRGEGLEDTGNSNGSIELNNTLIWMRPRATLWS